MVTGPSLAAGSGEASSGAAERFRERMRRETLTFVTAFRHPVRKGMVAWHSHDPFEIVYHATGWGATAYEPDEELDFREGSLVIYPPRLRHNQTNGIAGEDWCLLGTCRGNLPEVLNRVLYCPAITDPELIGEFAALAAAPPVATPWQQARWSHGLTALVLRIVEQLWLQPPPGKGRADRYVDAACSYLAEHYSSIPSLEVVADHVGISYDHLRHLFRRSTGMSMVQYLTWVRVEHAKRLLRHSAIPVKAVAGQCGYGNDRYFSRVFQALAGCAPGRFRRACHELAV